MAWWAQIWEGLTGQSLSGVRPELLLLAGAVEGRRISANPALGTTGRVPANSTAPNKTPEQGASGSFQISSWPEQLLSATIGTLNTPTC